MKKESPVRPEQSDDLTIRSFLFAHRVCPPKFFSMNFADRCIKTRFMNFYELSQNGRIRHVENAEQFKREREGSS